MLEKPTLDENLIVDHLRKSYQVYASEIEFLPVGADPNTAAYKIITANQEVFFLKIRFGYFDEASAIVPTFLVDQGIQGIMAPMETKDHHLWLRLSGFVMLLYPFLEGIDSINQPLKDEQWISLGKTVRQIHSVIIPTPLMGLVSRDSYSSGGREVALASLIRADLESFTDPIALKTVSFLNSKAEEIRNLVARTEELAANLTECDLQPVLCHTDLFAGNIMVTEEGKFAIVDWDGAMLAPKEKDLMYIGGGVCGVWNTLEEHRLFYEGYGPVEINPTALAYYRYERIIQDIAVITTGIMGSKERHSDRAQSFGFLTSNFQPGGVLEIAYQTDRDMVKIKE